MATSYNGNNPDLTTSSGCPIPQEIVTIFMHGTSHRVMYVFSGACVAFTLVSSVGLILLHLTRYRVPREQRHIIRIVFMPSVSPSFQVTSSETPQLLSCARRFAQTHGSLYWEISGHLAGTRPCTTPISPWILR